MRILLLGDKGQLGTILKRELSKQHSVLVLPDRVESVYQASLQNMLRCVNVVINCLAISNTRECEKDWEKSLFVNVKFPVELARQLNENKYHIKFIHISTGCIFDGNKEPHLENSKPTPHIAYSRQKLMAESIQWIYDNSVILRPRMIFSELETKANLLYKVKSFKHFLDEKNSMTAAIDIAKFIEIVIEKDLRGIFNICNQGMSSPYEIRVLMSKLMDWKQDPIFPISKTSLRKVTNLKLTDTWIESKYLDQYYQMPPVEDRLKEMIVLSKEWLQK